MVETVLYSQVTTVCKMSLRSGAGMQGREGRHIGEMGQMSPEKQELVRKGLAVHLNESVFYPDSDRK